MEDKPITWDAVRQLAKTREDKKIFGICAGLGKYTPIPTWMWRAAFVITGLWGLGVIVYIVLEIFMPKESEQ